MEPGIEPVRITKPGQVPPGSHQRVLDRVARELRVPKDEARGRVQPRSRRRGEHGEGVVIASPRPARRAPAGPRPLIPRARPAKRPGLLGYGVAARRNRSAEFAPSFRTVDRGMRRCCGGVPGRGHAAPRRAPVRGGRRRARGHRADRPAGPADAVGRVQPGPATRGRGGSRRCARRSRRRAARTSTSTVFGPWISECAAQFIPCVSEEVYHRRYQEPDKIRRTATEIEWPIPYWWVDIGATMQNVMLAAVDEGLGCGFVGTEDMRAAPRAPADPRRVHADRRDAGGPAAPRRPVAEPQARLGAVRAVRPVRRLGLRRRVGAAPLRGRRPQQQVSVAPVVATVGDGLIVHHEAGVGDPAEDTVAPGVDVIAGARRATSGGPWRSCSGVRQVAADRLTGRAGAADGSGSTRR